MDSVIMGEQNSKAHIRDWATRMPGATALGSASGQAGRAEDWM